MDFLLSGLQVNRTGKAWRRYPFYYSLLALTEIEHPKVDEELRYIAPECEKKLARLKPGDELSERRKVVLERVLQRL